MKSTSAFSLLELLVVLAVMALLASLANTRLPGWVTHQRLRAEVDHFISLIAVARHTAIIQGVTVVMCPAPTPALRCGGRDQWHQGTMVFVDRDSNRQVDPADRIIRRLPATRHSRIQWRSFRNRSYLKFTARGLTDWQNGHFLFCPQNGDSSAARQIVLNFAGRTYLSDDNNGDGIDEDRQGQPLSCT